jgi:cytochrome c oxidase subunit 4
MEHTQEEIQKAVRTYILVFVALMILTVITVAVSYLDLSVFGAIVVALIVASIKGSLVACYFMHLIAEKAIIYWSLGITVVLFLVLMLVPIFTDIDKLPGTVTGGF